MEWSAVSKIPVNSSETSSGMTFSLAVWGSEKIIKYGRVNFLKATS